MKTKGIGLTIIGIALYMFIVMYTAYQLLV